MSTESIQEVLTQFDPEPDRLLREISKQISDEMLQQIAAADYGIGQEEHLAALRQVRSTGTFPQNMGWYPGEVLELIRNSHPEASDVFGHWMRTFSTAALLRATREPFNYGDGVNTDYTLIQLVQSLRALPVDFLAEAIPFTAWLLLHSEPEGRDPQVCAYGIGLLWFALQRPAVVTDDALTSLAQWTMRRSKQLYPELILNGDLPLRMGVGNPPPSGWQDLGEAMFDLDLNSCSPELRGCVELIAAELAS